MAKTYTVSLLGSQAVELQKSLRVLRRNSAHMARMARKVDESFKRINVGPILEGLSLQIAQNGIVGSNNRPKIGIWDFEFDKAVISNINRCLERLIQYGYRRNNCLENTKKAFEKVLKAIEAKNVPKNARK